MKISTQSRSSFIQSRNLTIISIFEVDKQICTLSFRIFRRKTCLKHVWFSLIVFRPILARMLLTLNILGKVPKGNSLEAYIAGNSGFWFWMPRKTQKSKYNKYLKALNVGLTSKQIKYATLDNTCANFWSRSLN
jgi:hypothetical protein